MKDNIIDKLRHHQAQAIGKSGQYSVLLPLMTIDGQDHILYQIRSSIVSQPGEVAFPGGAVEAGEDLAQAAIRETCEELNLSPDDIQLIGELGYITNPRATIHCFVGYLKKDSLDQIHPNEEVARLFTLPVTHLMEHNPTYYQLKQEVDLASDFPFDRLPQGKDYPFSHFSRKVPFYMDLDENLWGLTANFTEYFINLIK